MLVLGNILEKRAAETFTEPPEIPEGHKEAG